MQVEAVKMPDICVLSKSAVMGISRGKKRVKIIGVEKQGVTSEQAMQILRKQGIVVDEKEAKKILDFLYILGKLSVNQYVNNKCSEEEL